MKQVKYFLLVVLLSYLFSLPSYSQIKFNAGTFTCSLNGATLSFPLNIDVNERGFTLMGGTSDFGLIKIKWTAAPSDVIAATFDLSTQFVQNYAAKITISWGDFLSQ